jgi:hypothetical protein
MSRLLYVQDLYYADVPSMAARLSTENTADEDV